MVLTSWTIAKLQFAMFGRAISTETYGMLIWQMIFRDMNFAEIARIGGARGGRVKASAMQTWSRRSRLTNDAGIAFQAMDNGGGY